MILVFNAGTADYLIKGVPKEKYLGVTRGAYHGGLSMVIRSTKSIASISVCGGDCRRRSPHRRLMS